MEYGAHTKAIPHEDGGMAFLFKTYLMRSIYLSSLDDFPM